MLTALHLTDKQVYCTGPNEVLCEAAEPGAGWHDIPVPLLLALIRFNDDQSEIVALQECRENSLLAGIISVDESGGGSKRQKPSDDAEAQYVSSQRSAMCRAYARNVLRVEDAIGFVPVCLATNTQFPGIADLDPLQPRVVEIGRLQRIRHRVQVDGTHEWRFYICGTPTDDIGRTLLQGVRVIGNSLPDAFGRIHSKAMRLRETHYKAWRAKRDSTEAADARLARPDLLTQESAAGGSGGGGGGGKSNRHRELAMQSNVAADAVFGKAQAMRPTPCEGDGPDPALRADTAVGEETLRRNQGLAPSKPGDSRRPAAQHAYGEYALPEGRQLVAGPAVSPPHETAATLWQVFLEAVCLEWSTPKQLISSGDSTGAPKLNAPSASAETAKIFTDAQQSTCRMLEAELEQVYALMHGQSRLRAFLVEGVTDDDTAELEEGELPRESKKKRKPEESRSVAALHAHARFVVRLAPCATLEQLLILHDKGILKYEAMPMVIGQKLRMCNDWFEDRCAVPREGTEKPATSSSAK